MTFDYAHQTDWPMTSGQHQSPIDIQTSKTQDSQLSAISWRGLYQAQSITGEATTLKAHGIGAAYLNDRDFTFQQLHFHTPAEHLIDGQAAPIEWHLVHRSATGQLAVVAVFGRIGKPNQSFQGLLDQFTPEASHDLTEPVNLTELLPDTGTIYHYLGSLTTPPLSETVEWYVCADTVMIGEEQLAAYQRLFAANNRAIQPLNDRPIIAERF
ncbi:carbonic anhydrase family protein [Lactiplantibacillus pentosus]|uniref:carbonic anhydrase family protein n=1 Tax=Lactiplantibacillus pentosus TaxID=1589 RepID=UPI0021A2AE67|nr:carbonic anhydrase family protein [Lactiplantibacillus pentosus]MCT3286362.1 carbonic anhydrase family protein [Lactiplantibacillus pentosus]